MPVIESTRTDQELKAAYLNLLSEMTDKVCPKGTLEEHASFYKKFREAGYYVPIRHQVLDNEAVSSGLRLIDKKISFINDNIVNLKKIKSFRSYVDKTVELEREFKKIYFKNAENYIVTDKKLIEKNVSETKTSFNLFKKKYKEFLGQIEFLRSLDSPLNHFQIRSSYDTLRSHKDEYSQRKANELYLRRKILEDGPLLGGGVRTDFSLRSLLDTVEINLFYTGGIISDDLRIDVIDSLKQIRYTLELGPSEHINRQNEWLERTTKTKEFYVDLKDQYKKNPKKIKDYIENMNNARDNLSRYSHKKHTQVLEFWKNKPEDMVALYVLDNILLHEVGDVDGEAGLERQDVAQVVLNRFQSRRYNRIPKIDPHYAELKDEKNPANKWLTLLFKKSEFSFTLFFFQASKYLYCTDYGASAKTLRDQNLKFALTALRQKEASFSATRYYSRISMNGRIRMDSLWDDAIQLPERKGSLIKSDKKLKTALKNNELNLVYTFLDDIKEHNFVYDWDGSNYVYDQEKDQFFQYRNPHHFRYFKEKR